MIRLQALLFILTAVALGPAAGAEGPIDVGDRVSVTVVGEADQTRSYVVDVEGNIAAPLIGKVPLRGLFPAQAREELIRRLSRFIRGPQVTVEILQRAQIVVGVTGMVGKPGSLTLERGQRLLDALAQAEGYTLEADPQNVRLQRRGEPQARALDLSKIDRDASLNLVLQDGDAIFIPRLPLHVVRVLGAVNKPGEIQRKDAVTLLEAVLAAGGLTPEAEGRGLQILKKDAARPTAIDLNDVLAGRAENVRLQDGDVVTVPAVPKHLVKVFGQVLKPGESLAREGTTVRDSLTAAGGFTPEADRTAVILTSASGAVRKLNLEKVDAPDGAVVLEPGSQLFIPLAVPRRFAVAGGVNEPGLFPFPPDPTQRVFLTDALAQAKGTVDRARKKNIVIVRKNPAGGQPVMLQVDLEALLKKRTPENNPEILVSDVVYVDVEPERDRGRPTLLERVLSVAGAFFAF